MAKDKKLNEVACKSAQRLAFRARDNALDFVGIAHRCSNRCDCKGASSSLECLQIIAATAGRGTWIEHNGDPVYRRRDLLEQLAAMQTAAPSLGVELQPIDARDVGEFERVLADFAGTPNGGLIVPLSTSAETHRTRIIALADRHRLPAVYPTPAVG